MRWLQIASFTFLIPSVAFATRWNEPFHEELVRRSDAFAKIRVLSAEEDKKSENSSDFALPENDPSDLNVEVLAVYAGDAPKKLTVSHYTFNQYYGDEHSGLGIGGEYYVFLEKDDRGWGIATPTAGFVEAKDDLIVGSYRISCAGGFYETQWYVETQTLLFQLLHGDQSNKAKLSALVTEQLKQPSKVFGGIGDPKLALTFFKQSASNEILAMMPELAPNVNLDPFLAAADFHAQISGIRALSARKGKLVVDRLIGFLTEPTSEAVPRVVAVRALQKHAISSAQRKRLITILATADTERVDLCGGSIMDPRIVPGYTSVSLKMALSELLDSLKAK